MEKRVHAARRAPKAKSARVMGKVGEDKACAWLESRGFRILARNCSTRFGEIDIIALKNDVLHFIEVKSFSSSSLSPRYAITPKKLEKIYTSIAALQTYENLAQSASPSATQELQKALQNLHAHQHCVDALLIWGDSIELLENISLETSYN